MSTFTYASSEFVLTEEKWLPDMDLNHDKQIQSLLCYRYTIGQTSVLKVEPRAPESRLRSYALSRASQRRRSAGFPTCCIAGFQPAGSDLHLSLRQYLRSGS